MSLWDDQHAFGTKSLPTSEDFLVTIAVGGGVGCPESRDA